MAIIKVNTNGQTLIVYSSSATLYSDGEAAQSAVTLPATITADTTYYTATSASSTALVIKQIDGTTILSSTLDLSAGVPYTLNPRPTTYDLASDDYGYGHLRRFVSGRYYGPSFAHTASTTAPGTGLMTLVPLWVPEPCTTAALVFEATATASTAVCRLGIYNNNATQDTPNTLLVDAGTGDASTAAVVEVTLSQALNRGLYWLAAVSQTASATFRTCGATGSPLISAATAANAFGANANNCYYKSGITGALADLAAGSTPTTGGIKIAVKIA